jgi:hypothetical protein
MSNRNASSVRSSAALVAAVNILGALGCGNGGICPVDGQVVWKDGSPATELKGAEVVFDLPEKQTGARGSVEADGSFKLTTNNPGDGALAGDYKVLIFEIGRKPKVGGEEGELAPGAIDIRYADPRTSDLVATVKPGSNKITLTVDRWRQ